MQPPTDYFSQEPTFQELALTLAIAKLIAALPPEELQGREWFQTIVFAEQNPEGTPEARKVLLDEMARLSTQAFFAAPKALVKESLINAGLSEFEVAKVLRRKNEGES